MAEDGPARRQAALGAMLARVIPEVSEGQAAVLATGKPADVLRLRQALRRLRVLLGLLAREAPSPLLADLRDKARSMTAALAQLRALDAFWLETLPRARRAGLSRRDAQRLGAAASRARPDTLAAARAALASDRLADFGACLAALPAVASPAIVLSPGLAGAFVGRLHRRMLRLGAGLSQADSEARHRLRLAGKALVALAALVEPEVPLKRRAIRRATRLTAAIGSARDREQALAIAMTFVEPEATAAFAAVIEHVARNDERRVRRRWRAFRKAPPPRPRRP